MSYVLCDQRLLSALRVETSEALKSNGFEHHDFHKYCPRLTAVYHEVLRLTFGTVSVRKVITSADVHGKKLRAGGNVMVPARQLHYDEETFGSTADGFDSERFLHNGLHQSSSFMPFGQGEDAFPQHFLAKQEILVFVALLINRFDVELVGNPLGGNGVPTLPDIDYTCPTLGIMPPVKGTDLYIKLKQAI